MTSTCGRFGLARAAMTARSGIKLPVRQ
jgi:hypothetical protein